MNFIQNTFDFSWYLGWISDLNFSYLIWKYFWTFPHLYWCNYVLIPSRKIFGNLLVQLYTECGEWSEWSFRELQKNMYLSVFRKIALKFSFAPIWLIKFFKSEIILWIFSLTDLLFTAGIIEAFNINHLHIFLSTCSRSFALSI